MIPSNIFNYCERKIVTWLAIVFFAAGGGARADAPALSALTECQPRAGLPNFFSKLAAGGEVRIAYFGGSITEQTGWRGLSLGWFRTNYPHARVSEINAAISGTGGELGVCRIDGDVLAHDPDLVFVEFAVNGIGDTMQRSVRSIEGIVRKIWRHNPATDICFVYTLSEWQLNSLKQGKIQSTAAVMERVAEHYSIPSINFGVEVARLEQGGKLLFKAEKNSPASKGKIIFSGDGVHPYADTGHPLYLAALVRSVPQLKATGIAGPHTLALPVDADNWENSRCVPLAKISPDADWTALNPLEIPGCSANGTSGAARNYPARFAQVWKATKPGASLAFRFNGTGFGIFGVSLLEVGRFSVQVDDHPPVTGTFFDRYLASNGGRAWTWFYPGDLPAGEHHVRIELLAESPDKVGILRAAGEKLPPAEQLQGIAEYFGDLLVAGEIQKNKLQPK